MNNYRSTRPMRRIDYYLPMIPGIILAIACFVLAWIVACEKGYIR